VLNIDSRFIYVLRNPRLLIGMLGALAITWLVVAGQSPQKQLRRRCYVFVSPMSGSLFSDPSRSRCRCRCQMLSHKSPGECKSCRPPPEQGGNRDSAPIRYHFLNPIEAGKLSALSISQWVMRCEASGEHNGAVKRLITRPMSETQIHWGAFVIAVGRTKEKTERPVELSCSKYS